MRRPKLIEVSEADISAVSFALSGAIMITHQAAVNRGMSRNRAYTVTMALLVGMIVKFIEDLREGEQDG